MTYRQSAPSHIRDSLYSLIELSPAAVRTINHPDFLRLEGIQQLGFASTVWPGARHTRFEHSLGVMHLAERAIQQLRSTPDGDFITDSDAQVVIAAALLHDIGHYPFSHAIEELGDPVRSHEVVGAGIITSGVVAETLENDWGLDPARVAAMVRGDSENQSETDLILSGLLSGTLDMDKLDYLPRDARACNVPYGGVDAIRLISSLTVVEAPGGKRRIGIGAKGVSPLHSLINARQEMFDNVYWHHTNRACMIMLLRAVQDALMEGAIDADTLTGHRDTSLLQVFQSRDMPQTTYRLATALSLRHIHKRAIEISARADTLYSRLSRLWHSPTLRREVELRMVEILRELTTQEVSDTAILIDIPKPEKWKTDVWVAFDRPPVGMQSLMHWQDVVGVVDSDLKRYEEHRRLIRLVAEESLVGIVHKHWEHLLIPALDDLNVEGHNA